MTARLSALAAFAVALASCRQIQTIPPMASPVSQEEIAVTGVGLINTSAEWPIHQDQIYPQLRARAFEMALHDAQSKLLARIAERPVAGGRRLGDLMERHESVQLLAQDFVNGLPNDPPFWDWERGEVDVDLRVSVGQLESFVGSLPLLYLAGTEPRDGAPDYSPLLPPPDPLAAAPGAPPARPLPGLVVPPGLRTPHE